MDPDILACDNHLLVVRKPAGLPVVPDASGDPSLLEASREWVRREFAKPGNVFLGVVHRLDRPVSGVVVFARTSKAARRLTDAFRERRVHKVYRGVTAGELNGEAGVIEQWLWKDTARNVVQVVRPGRSGAKEAVTRWRVLAHARGRTLIEFVPETGRSHQLRVAAAVGLGAPLLGDLKYGASKPLADKSVGLHALAIELEHPTQKERMRFTCPPPELEVWRFPGVDD